MAGNGLYKHHSGNCYIVVGVAIDARGSAPPLIVYREESSKIFWARPKSDFVMEFLHETGELNLPSEFIVNEKSTRSDFPLISVKVVDDYLVYRRVNQS